MPETGDLSSLRDRLTKLEFETSQRPSKEFVQAECEKVLTKASVNDKERNQALLSLFDERLGAHRSAIITELERDLNEFKSDALKMIENVLREKLPGAVKVEVDKIEEAKQAEKDRERAEQEAKIQRYRNRIAFVGSCVVLLTALVTFYFSLRAETSPTEVRHLDSVGDAISSF